ncbi:related to PSF2 - part of GINS, replication multiprotein complex [Melanopsichium pennsylvanicum]|uniref:DNA replication complex GINS protein PSF2 n=2 Tax=Melanopsichium pennsylvanicum TaxID=63383 RepID=A0AAJ5C3F8_9BASI|nr:related to PSF2-part of GINS, replication multiprotein complex [Melanopsichium pennsylvanicum 4]SNX82547.1 related to PSF2 - part of GINS, replication multiprotein complex [Melanopsichium pennsylvanicum]
MASSFASTSTSSSSSVASTSLSTTAYTKGSTPFDLDLATTSLSTTSLTIIPLTSVDRVRLLSGIYGPFRPPQPSLVPLWVALHLKKRKKAIIVPPTWLTVDSLTETLQLETTQPGFSNLPHYWVGVSQTLLSNAADDIPNSNRVRALLKDIREARQSKILSGVPMINSVHLQMHHISAYEVAELRGFFNTAFSHLKALRAPSEVEAEEKRQNELDSRSRWMLMPPLPTSLAMNDTRMQSSRPSEGGATTAFIPRTGFPLDQEDESINTTINSDSIQTAATTSAGVGPRKSNVSDSGYYSAPPNDGPSASPPQQPRPQRSAQHDTSDTNRPPRFAVDDEDDDDNS